MNTRQQRLLLEQADQKLAPFLSLANPAQPGEGWIYTIRRALNISLRQLGSKMNITAQSINAFENREKEGTITLQSLKEVADALNMHVVYALVPKQGTLQDMVHHKAAELARQIVQRTSQSMALENQKNAQERIEKSIREKTIELENEIPKHLWD